jgi:hypothetical protein
MAKLTFEYGIDGQLSYFSMRLGLKWFPPLKRQEFFSLILRGEISIKN